MTIPAGDNWCPTCEEVCHDHPSVCTVCGSTLVAAPTVQSSRRNLLRVTDAATNTASALAIMETVFASSTTNGGEQPSAEALLRETRQVNANLQRLVQTIRQQIRATGQAQEELLQDLRNTRAEWETIPTELLNPNNQANSSHRPTSRAVLKDMPRIVLQEHSSLLHRAVVTLYNDKATSAARATATKFEEMQAVLADFAVDMKGDWSDCQLVVAQPPRTGKGGTLGQETLDQIQEFRGKKPVILYMERGDGVTFVKKMLLAAKAGAVACIIGNSMEEPWPYIMKDSKQEAGKLSASDIVPTVMVKQSDAQKLVQWAQQRQEGSSAGNGSSCRLENSKPVRDCIICTDVLDVQQEVLRLPHCGHVFHVPCAMQWLNAHNTCPYCRRELPTDDEEYEQERRRTQRTHAGGSVREHNQSRDFYG